MQPNVQGVFVSTPRTSWKPTAELRWHLQEVMVDVLTLVDRKTLQQKWVKGPQEEWRDVPTYVNPRTKVDRW